MTTYEEIIREACLQSAIVAGETILGKRKPTTGEVIEEIEKIIKIHVQKLEQHEEQLRTETETL